MYDLSLLHSKVDLHVLSIFLIQCWPTLLHNVTPWFWLLDYEQPLFPQDQSSRKITWAGANVAWSVGYFLSLRFPSRHVFSREVIFARARVFRPPLHYPVRNKRLLVVRYVYFNFIINRDLFCSTSRRLCLLIGSVLKLRIAIYLLEKNK